MRGPRRTLLSGTGRVLSLAEAYWDARYYSGTGKLLDSTGHGHDMEFGSTSGSDTNDPLLLLPESNRPYLYISGVSGNDAVVNYNGFQGISTGTLSVRIRVHHDTFRPSATEPWIGSTAGRIRVRITTAGTLSVRIVESGGDATDVPSTAAIPNADADLWIRFDYSFDTQTATFYTAPAVADEANAVWAQLGDAVPYTRVDSHGSISQLWVGSQSGTSTSLVKAKGFAWYRNGARAGFADFTDIAGYNSTRTSFVGSLGNTFTLNRSTSGRKLSVVDRPLFLLGTDDYFEAADHASLDFDAGESFTAVVALRQYATPLNAGRWLSKKTGSAGYSLRAETTNLHVQAHSEDAGAGAFNPIGAAVFNAGELVVAASRRRAGVDYVAFTNGVPGTAVADSSNGSLVNAVPLRIGARSDATLTPQEFEFLAAAVFRRALSTRQLVELNRELGVV